MSRRLQLPVLLLAGATALSAARPMTFDDLVALHRVSDPQPSPDGSRIAYVVTDANEPENRTDSDIWIVSAAGGTPRRLTFSPKHDRHPRWSPDGRWIAFESNRGDAFQVWLIPADGGEAHVLTSLSTGATEPTWSPDGSRIAFLSSVFPAFSDKPFAESDRLNREKSEALEKSKVKAQVFERLPVRKWDSLVDGRRSHLFVVGVTNGVQAGSPKDLTPGEQDAVPWSSTFAAGAEFAWSPDSKEIVHTASQFPVREEAWSTDHNLWAVDVATGSRRQLTTNAAADGCPRISPDGRWLAFRAQSRAGFEADRWQLHLLDRGTGALRSLTADFDSSVENISWMGSDRVVIEAEDHGTKRLWSLAVLGGGRPEPLTEGGSSGEAASVRGGAVVFTRASLDAPTAVWIRPADGKPTKLVDPNTARLAELDLSKPESVVVKGDDGDPVQMWILRPPGFDASKKTPLVFWVHGGPQGAWMDGWSTRWNPQAWAAQGWIVAMPNPRGSTGFGQKFTDQISHDWGGRVFTDLMACADWCAAQPWIDKDRMAAAGGSYGGYMMNWFQSHTDRFKTLVTHCGVYEFHSMYGTTDELWFDEWEHGIPWKNPDFAQHSPDRFAAKFRTPNLIIHNERDYRVPIGQGFALFTALQRQGVPSKLLYFPDEGHWVLKPQNSRLWHDTIFDWLRGYIGTAK